VLPKYPAPGKNRNPLDDRASLAGSPKNSLFLPFLINPRKEASSAGYGPLPLGAAPNIAFAKKSVLFC
jgi:hypothetical protein